MNSYACQCFTEGRNELSKRAAIILAAVVVVGLFAAMAAVTFHINSLHSLSAQASGKRHEKPIIRTKTRTITVHKRGHPAGGAVQTIVPVRATSPNTSGTSGGGGQSTGGGGGIGTGGGYDSGDGSGEDDEGDGRFGGTSPSPSPTPSPSGSPTSGP